MKKIILPLLLFFQLHAFSQQSLKEIRKSGRYTLVYTTTAKDAEIFIADDSIGISKFENIDPYIFSLSDSFNQDKLPRGLYVIITAADYLIKSELIVVSDLKILTVNNRHTPLIAVRDKEGVFFNDAKVFVNNKPLRFDAAKGGYAFRKNIPDDAPVKIYTASDTLYTILEKDDDDYNGKKISEQRRQNYHYTKIYRILNYIPSKFKNLFPSKSEYKRPKTAEGFIVLNQPKYKLTDTVKFKGYVLNRKLKQHTGKMDLHLRYYDKGKYVDQLIKTIKPVTPGAYVDEFILSDTLPLDQRFTLSLVSAGKKQELSSNFSTEDYVLPQISKVAFEMNKTFYYPGDSLSGKFYAKDANGFYILEGSARLVITATLIRNISKDTVFVADTLYDKEMLLSNEEESKFSFPATIFPAADLSLNATMIFKNSNNELKEKSIPLYYRLSDSAIVLTQTTDSLKAIFSVNGRSINMPGEMEKGDETEVAIKFPYTCKIDPAAETYYFSAAGINKEFTPERYRVEFSERASGDTTGFYIYNPYRIPVWYTVLNNNKIEASGSDTGQLITWYAVPKNARKGYTVRWQYIWGGKEYKETEYLYVRYKMLFVDIEAAETVYPGQKDSLKISVKDFKNRPAKNVNLTAAGYTSQFGPARIPRLPYLPKLIPQKSLQYGTYVSEPETSLLTDSHLIGENFYWVQKLGLDTMLYYKFLLPGAPFFDHASPRKELLPEVSVNLVSKGIPQEIYLLYLNRQIRYYNGVTDSAAYSFTTFPDNVQFGIRTKNKFIEIDSIYLQPFYKHDISFDLDHLPPHSRVRNAPDFWTDAEINTMEQTMMQIRQEYNTRGAYIGQQNSVVKLGVNMPHIAGPFTTNAMTFFRPGRFDLTFTFEPGYQYSFTQNISRLEKKLLFPPKKEKYYLPLNYKPAMKLGDTIASFPNISYPPAPEPRAIRVMNYRTTLKSFYEPTGKLMLFVPADSSFVYFLFKERDSINYEAVHRQYGSIDYLPLGVYDIKLVTANFSTISYKNVVIKKGGIQCVNLADKKFDPADSTVLRLIKEESAVRKNSSAGNETISGLPYKDYRQPASALLVKTGGGAITGVVTDSKGGLPIEGASVTVLGYQFGSATDKNGGFSLLHLRPGKYMLRVACVGYQYSETIVDVVEGTVIRINMQMINAGNTELTTVVVTALGVRRQAKELGYAATVITTNTLTQGRSSGVAQALNGKVSGMSISSNSGVFEIPKIRIRGIRSLTGDNTPMFIVNGLIVKSIDDLRPDQILSITILKGSEASAVYGPDAANGVIIIITGEKTLRKDFRDYAFWLPNFVTDKNGQAAVQVEYPDNITGWNNVFLAIDKKRRVGYKTMAVKSFKPVSAELKLPEFLIETDTADLKGIVANYTEDKYAVSSSFTVNKKNQENAQKDLLPKSAFSELMKYTPENTDTLQALFRMETSTGFRDGEERKIPVFLRGTTETEGKFWILRNDSTVSFNFPEKNTQQYLYAQNNTLKLLLDELDHLNEYPYYCMEQTASKLTGLALEEKIRAALKEKFSNEKEQRSLLKKLQQSQSFDGGWSWWNGGKTDINVTLYVAKALLQFRSDPLTENNLRNAFLYLHNQLPFIEKQNLIPALSILSEGGHEMDYGLYLHKIKFDSLSVHAKWLYVKILQNIKADHEKELAYLLNNKINSMTGGIHWGEENYRWYSNEIATTVTAFTVLENEKSYKAELDGIIQYFLERKQNGYWRNTVESASILSAILPEILKAQADFRNDAVIKITGDTVMSSKSFPLKIPFSNNVKNISITKSGGGLVYLTAHSKKFVKNPEPVTENFIVNTSFPQGGKNVTAVKTGEKIIMTVSISVLKDAQYVMIEMPVPAGCIFGNKIQLYGEYREYRKEKLLIFKEMLEKGDHSFTVELEPRFNGTFNINPAKAELMYFPVFFGRNSIKNISIVK